MSNELQSSPHQASEWRVQERALEASRRGALASGDPQVDAYRTVFHAVSLVPRSDPPVDFAECTLRAMREAEVDDHIERWMIRIVGLVALLALTVFAGPMLVDTLSFSAVQAMPAAGTFASPLLWAAIAGVAAAAVLDSWKSARKHTSH
jgi:hypothetical protein